MTIDRNRLEADLRDILAPELSAAGARTMYVVWESATGRRTKGMCGFTGPALASIYRTEIEALGTWQGLAPGIFICDESIRSTHDYEQSTRIIVSAAAHEAGHVIAEGCQYREANPEFCDQFKTLLEDATGDKLETEFPEGGHDLNFIRATLHIGYRLESMGHDLEVDDLWREGELFKPSAFLPYVQDEFERLRGLSVSEVLATDPPGQFKELFAICQRMAAAKNN